MRCKYAEPEKKEFLAIYGALKISGKGTIYRFPLDKKDECVYCNFEGVDWLTKDRIVAVADCIKTDNQPGRRASKDKSIHIMKVPA